MKNALSTWAKNISPSPTLAVDAKAKKLKSEGKDVCGFGAGEPDFDTPEFIKEACIKAIEAGKTKYLPSAGLPALREALAAHYAKRRGISYNASNFIVSPGGKFSCYLAIMSVISPGDEVIIPAPYWVSYPEMVKLAGGTPVYVKATDAADFKVTVQQLESVCTPKTKLLILTSPSNPTGAVYSAQELKEIMDFAIARDILVMSDEIYSTLVYDGVEAISPASLSEEAKEHTIVVSGFSKAFSMTGWRLGTLCAPDAIAKAVANLQSQTSSNATSFAQYGALAAMENEALADAAVAEMKKSFDRRRLMLLEGLNAIDGVFCRRAQGAFYLFPNISSFGMASVDFCAKLLEEKLVAVVPGSAFGSDETCVLATPFRTRQYKKGLNEWRSSARKLDEI